MAAMSTLSFDAGELDAPFDGAARRSYPSGFGARRSHVATMPSLREAPTAAGNSAGDSWEGIEPDAPSSLVSQMPEWCVDLGEELVALHAVELYARLATGSIAPDARVWRPGREAWLPAREVPELRYAIEDARASQIDFEDFMFGDFGGLDDVEAALAFAKAG